MKPSVSKFIKHRRESYIKSLRRITSPRKMIAGNLKSLRRNAGRKAAFAHASKTSQVG